MIFYGTRYLYLCNEYLVPGLVFLGWGCLDFLFRISKTILPQSQLELETSNQASIPIKFRYSETRVSLYRYRFLVIPIRTNEIFRFAVPAQVQRDTGSVQRKTRVFVRHVVEYENGSFLIAGQCSAPVRLPEPVVSGLLR